MAKGRYSGPKSASKGLGGLGSNTTGIARLPVSLNSGPGAIAIKGAYNVPKIAIPSLDNGGVAPFRNNLTSRPPSGKELYSFGK